jgi:protein-L-isoaspartate(D-aspartate) O-methyltransferase
MTSTARALRFFAAAALWAALPGCDQRPPASPVEAPAGNPASTDEFARARSEMVKALREIPELAGGERVLEAMSRVPRHEFVPPRLRSRAYAPTPLPILEDQTISQPEIVAVMTHALALKGDERVLEIGTGSGYQAAVLGELAPEVYTVEIRPALAASARKTLESLRQKGVLHFQTLEVVEGDGFQGYAKAAPFDAIIVTAAPRQVPTELINQLKPGGRMVIPVGDFHQELQLITKGPDGTHFTQNMLPVRFVPMVGPSEAR